MGLSGKFVTKKSIPKTWPHRKHVSTPPFQIFVTFVSTNTGQFFCIKLYDNTPRMHCFNRQTSQLADCSPYFLSPLVPRLCNLSERPKAFMYSSTLNLSSTSIVVQHRIQSVTFYVTQLQLIFLPITETNDSNQNNTHHKWILQRQFSPFTMFTDDRERHSKETIWGYWH